MARLASGVRARSASLRASAAARFRPTLRRTQTTSQTWEELGLSPEKPRGACGDAEGMKKFYRDGSPRFRRRPGKIMRQDRKIGLKPAFEEDQVSVSVATERSPSVMKSKEGEAPTTTQTSSGTVGTTSLTSKLEDRDSYMEFVMEKRGLIGRIRSRGWIP